MTGTTKTEDRASTAKQIARSSQEDNLTMDDIAICYKVFTGSDPETIIDQNQERLMGHPELQRIRISRTTAPLIEHAVRLANLIDDYKGEIVDDDVEMVIAFCNGETNYCPDHAQLMSVLNQYGIVLRKCSRDHTWMEMMYGGPDFDKFFDRDDLGSQITSQLKRIERDADKMDLVRKIQIVGFSDSDYVFLLWTDTRGVKYIAYARKDWGIVKPLDFAA